MEIIYLIIGWVLGQFGTYITDGIRRRKEAKLLLDAILAELEDLRIRLILVFYIISIRRGLLMVDDFKWVYSQLQKYNGPIADPELKDSIANLASLPRGEIEAALQSGKRTIALRRRAVNYSVAGLESTDLIRVGLDNGLLRRILEIKNRLCIYNDIVADCNYFFNLTFQSNISEENWIIVNDNLSKREEKLAEAAKDLAIRIESVIK